jgi:hypothetical protein
VNVRIKADHKQLQKGLGQAQRNVSGFATAAQRSMANVRTAALGVGAALAALGAAGFVLGRLTSSALAAGDAIDKMSQRAGVSAGVFQQLAHAASLSDVSAEQLTQGMFNLARSTLPVFKGVSDVRERLLLTADAVSNARNETEAATIAQKAFGIAGRQLLPLLKEGRGGIEGMMAEARRLGLVLSDDAVKGAAAASDSIDRLKRRFETIKNEMLLRLAPAIEEVATKFLEWLGNDQMMDRVERLAGWIERMARSLQDMDPGRLPRLAEEVSQGVAGFAASPSGLGTFGAVGGAASGAIGKARAAAEPFLNLRAAADQYAQLTKKLSALDAQIGVNLKNTENMGKIAQAAALQADALRKELTLLQRAVATLDPVLRLFGALKAPLSSFFGGLATIAKSLPLVGRAAGFLAAIFRVFTLKVQVIIAAVVGAFQGLIDVWNAFAGTNHTVTDALKGLGSIVVAVASKLGDLIFAVASVVRTLIQAGGRLLAWVTGNREAEERLRRQQDQQKARTQDFSGVQSGISTTAPAFVGPPKPPPPDTQLDVPTVGDFTGEAAAKAAERQREEQERINKLIEREKYFRDQMSAAWVSSLESVDRLQQAIAESELTIAQAQRGITERERSSPDLAGNVRGGLGL